MIVAVHTTIGAVVGEYLANPALAFLAGALLHFIFDALPHFDNVLVNKQWNWKQVVFTSIDLWLAFFIIFYILKAPFDLGSPVLWGAFGGFLPDLIDNVPFWNKQVQATKWGKTFHTFHENIHSRHQLSPFVGISLQLLIIILVLRLYF